MKCRTYNIICTAPGCNCPAKVVAKTIRPTGEVRRRCECDGPKHHRFWLFGNLAAMRAPPVRYSGPILSEWRGYPFTDTSALERAGI